MSNPQPRRLNSLFGKRTIKERRPAGISRKRKKQFGFESLEARQVMSATPLTYQSTSSTSTAGALEVLAREMYWQSLISSANQANSAVTSYSVPTDPYVGNQWHLVNSGQQVGNPDFQAIYGTPGEDINVAPVWQMGYTGAGVTVAVIDSGTQLNHPDLAANINLQLAMDALNPSGDGNPYFQDPTNAHGTAVAGLIGAVANNGIGGTGVAPGVSLVPIRLIDFGQTDQAFVDAFRHAIQQIDITNNSWGPAVDRGLSGPSPEELLAIRDSIIFGRGGLGVIHVFSAGNSAGTPFPVGFQSVGALDSSSYNGWVNSRYTIGVTGVDHDGFYNNIDGTTTGYPETSAAVLVAAPTGSNAAQNIANDTGLGSGLWTPDLTGEFGYNIAPNPTTGQEYDRDFLDDTNYTTRMNGTSASAPLVSGVIALMLEANPNLSWRDVQEILVRSARQNAPLAVPANGAATGSGLDVTQNTWIINQQPVFHDPDPFDAFIPIDPSIRTLFPTLDPNLSAVGDTVVDPDELVMHYQPTPQVLTNGAGYTISQGKGAYGEQIGYAHGVIDAEMAVRLAEQWSVKNQTLANELTFSTFVNAGATPIPAAEKGSQATGFQLVPGGLGGQAGFINFWEEYFVTDRVPFSQANPPDNTRGAPLFFSVPDSNTMSIETFELKVSIAGGTAAALDNLRILVVSPDGTHSELNHFFVEPNLPYTLQNDSPSVFDGDGLSVDTTGGNMVWTFSSNRSWGERSDNSIVFDATTGEPVINSTGVNVLASTLGNLNAALESGWQIHFENYGSTPLTLNGMEFVWHGRPIAAESQRIQGFVGVDDNRDDLFNFSRVVQSIVDVDQDPNTLRFSEVVNAVDLTQESFGANVTVNVRRANEATPFAQFVTGADGNFYFDLVPDDYVISIDDPLGRLAQEDNLTAAGLLQHYKTEWTITKDYFKVWDKAPGAPTDTLVDANGVPLAWLDDNGDEQIYGMKGINFLLDPGDAPLKQVTFNGVAYADSNGDGAFNSNDIILPNATVFADVNRNGVRDAGEIVVATDANGAYTLVVPTAAAAVMNVGIVTPAQWTVSNPAAKVHTRYVAPGNVFAGLDFYLTPPTTDNQGGGGANQPGILMGVVYQDLGSNPNGQRDSGEPGAPGFTVYIDNNNNGVLDAGDTSTVTNQNGAYIFTNVAAGQRVVRVVAPTPFQTTAPTQGRYIVQLVGSGTFSKLHFGIKDTAVLDYGDLPNIYGATTLAQNGARHKKGVYFLGTRIDGELNGNPTANADGDDVTGFDDDDGIVFDPIIVGSSVRLVATASRNNGYLKGWIDWNGDGDFDDANERLVFSGIGAATNNVLLSSGPNTLYFDVPAGVNLSNVYARFRYGELTINSIYGEAQIGEVEDYLLPIAPPAIPAVVGIPADFTGDDRVDGADFLVWQRNYGKTTGATQSHGSTNGDGDVDGQDLAIWKNSYGQVYSVASLTSEEDEADAPQSLAVQLQSFSGFASAVPVANATLSTSTTSQTSTIGASRRFEARPILANLADVADRLRQRADSLDERLEEGRDFVVELLHDVADRVEDFDFESVRRDRAFDDLFGSRRRQGLKVEAEAEAGVGVDADDAFALIADHFEVPRS